MKIKNLLVPLHLSVILVLGCQAAQDAGDSKTPSDSRVSTRNVSDPNQFAVVISSAGGAEFALESDAWRNGVFTYSVLEGILENKADRDGDGEVLVSELRDHVVERVQVFTEGMQTPTARSVNLELDFQVH